MSRWRMVPLGEFCDTRLGKMLDKKRENGLCPKPYLRNINVQWGKIDINDLLQMDFSDKEQAELRLIPGDLLVCEGGEVGRCAIWGGEIDECYFQKALHRIRPDQNLADSEFLYWMFWHLAQKGSLNEYTTHSTIAHLTGVKLRKIPIPLPPLDEQRRIVDLLNRGAGIRRLREQALATARNTIPALFLQTFGDLRTTANRYPIHALDDVSKIGSGLTKGRKLKGEAVEEAPYMRVANVQDGYLDLSDIKTIPATSADRVRYALQAGDLLLTEGGDPDKLGRGAIWEGQIEGCLHQNHVFRVRPDTTAVLPDYLSAAVGSAYGKEYFLRVAKRTTGIASVNRTQLGAFPLPLPPLDLQRRFAARLADLRGIIAQQEVALAKVRDLERALMGHLLG